MIIFKIYFIIIIRLYKKKIYNLIKNVFKNLTIINKYYL